MKLNKTIAIAVLLFGLLGGGLVAGFFLNQQPTSADAAPAVQQPTTCTDDDNVQDEGNDQVDNSDEGSDCDQNEADKADEADNADEADKAGEANGADESDNADALKGQTAITEDQAKAAAEAANPGAKTLGVELDQENENGGAVIYEIELDNGLDVKVDAANGAILKTEQRDAN